MERTSVRLATETSLLKGHQRLGRISVASTSRYVHTCSHQLSSHLGMQCFRQLCRYFHSFEQGDVPTNWSQAPQPPMNKSNNNDADWKCSCEPCKKDAHGSCTNKVCKFCCVVLGGCSINLPFSAGSPTHHPTRALVRGTCLASL